MSMFLHEHATYTKGVFSGLAIDEEHAIQGYIDAGDGTQSSDYYAFRNLVVSRHISVGAVWHPYFIAQATTNPAAIWLYAAAENLAVSEPKLLTEDQKLTEANKSGFPYKCTIPGCNKVRPKNVLTCKTHSVKAV